MRLPDVLTLLGVSRSTFWQGIRDGRYPPGVKIGRRATAWRAADIRALLERLPEGSRQRAA
jgi:predicted DNA-binding transcriptional regulator AlpA